MKSVEDFDDIFNDWLEVDGVKYYGPKYIKSLGRTAKNRLRELHKLRERMDEIYEIAKVSKDI